MRCAICLLGISSENTCAAEMILRLAHPRIDVVQHALERLGQVDAIGRIRLLLPHRRQDRLRFVENIGRAAMLVG